MLSLKCNDFFLYKMSRLMKKTRKWLCAQRRLRSDWVDAQALLCAQWVAKDPMILPADSEDSDQTGRMLRLIWVFAGRTVILLVLSCCGSNVISGIEEKKPMSCYSTFALTLKPFHMKTDDLLWRQSFETRAYTYISLPVSKYLLHVILLYA